MGLKNYRLNEKFRSLGQDRKKSDHNGTKIEANFQAAFSYYYIIVMLVLPFEQNVCISFSVHLINTNFSEKYSN